MSPEMKVGAEHVRQTADVCAALLNEHVEADWSGPIPDLDMSIAETVAHIAVGCIWYAIDLAAGGHDLQPVEHSVNAQSENIDLIRTVQAYASVVAAVVETAPASARGFHPMGLADASGFSAIACDEMLIHTDDAARGLGVEFTPPPALAEAVLRRLFPWVTDVVDPWSQLLWANGRIALDGNPRLDRWAWHCAPLDEWDGTVPHL